MTNIRVGFGFDVHQLKKEVPFYLGGVQIQHEKGAVGHSDADVLIHAICDALLGAACLRDIGYHFPDTDSTYKAIDSKILLEKVTNLVRKNNYDIVNIDCTICLQRPKISSYIQDMRNTLAQTMKLSEDYISIKATTTEKMGFIGKEEGVSAYSVTLIEKRI